MDLKEFQGVLDEATKGLKAEAEDAKQKAAEALTKYEEVKEQLEKSVSSETYEALELRVKALQDMSDTLAVKLNNPMKNKPETKASVWDTLKKQFEEKKTDLAKFVEAKNGSISLELKAAAMGTAIFGDRVIFGLREPGVDKVPFRQRFVFNLIQTINGGPGSNPLSWVEQQQVLNSEDATVNDAAAWTAESATKPVLKWKYVENKVSAEFLAATAIVTRQAVLNWPLLQSEIQNELMRKLYDVLDDSVINGDGTANSIFGIEYYAKDFNVGSIEAKTDPTDFDVIRAAIAQVKRGGAPSDRKRGGFNADYVLVSVDKAADMDMEKGNDGHYVLPPFTSADGSVIKGVRVIETNFVEGDEFIVGDFSKYLFNIVDGLRIDIGYINDQFVKNQFTIRAELYGMGRVKANEAYAFVKGTFTEAKAALVAGPAT